MTTGKCSDYGYVRYATQTPELEPAACNIAASAIDAPRPVGSYPYASHYGTYDQDGNVSEITETWDDLLGPDQMIAIGGGYDTDDVEIGLCNNTLESFPASESADLGFRIVEITGTGGCNDADLDNDGIVDAADLGSLISAWGPCGRTSCVADINRDGQVDGVDIGHMLGFWGPCPN